MSPLSKGFMNPGTGHLHEFHTFSLREICAYEHCLSFLRFIRRVSPIETEFPSVTVCPIYCYELDVCDTVVGVVDLGTIFMGVNVMNKDGSRFVNKYKQDCL